MDDHCIANGRTSSCCRLDLTSSFIKTTGEALSYKRSHHIGIQTLAMHCPGSLQAYFDSVCQQALLSFVLLIASVLLGLQQER